MLTDFQRKIYEFFLGFRLGNLPDTRYKERWENGLKELESHTQDSFIQGFDDLEFFKDLSLRTAVSIKFQEKTPDFYYAIVLFSVAREYVKHNTGPLTILETGTAKGFSALLLSRATLLEEKQATIYTLDIVPHEQPRFWNVFGDLNSGKRTRAELLKDYPIETQRINFLSGDSAETMGQINTPRIHIAFLDAMHEYVPLRAEFDFVSSRQEAGDLVIFDDVMPLKFPGVHKLVEEVEKGQIYSVQRVASPRGNTVAIATRQ